MSDARLFRVGLSSTTTNDFCRSRSFHLSVREMEWNQSRDCDSAQTVGKGYLDAVTLMWSPSAMTQDVQNVGTSCGGSTYVSTRHVNVRRMTPMRCFVS